MFNQSPAVNIYSLKFNEVTKSPYISTSPLDLPKYAKFVPNVAIPNMS